MYTTTVYVNDVQHIILDNMQFMISRTNSRRGGDSSSTFDKFDVQDVAVEKFRKFATDRNVHITIVVHPRKQQESVKLSIDSIYGSAKATQEADTVMILQVEPGGKKYVEIKKNRFNGDLGYVNLHFDRHSGRYADKPILIPATAAAGKLSSSKAHSSSNGGGGAFNGKPLAASAAGGDVWDQMFGSN
jgi:twinkle protein